MVFGLSLATLFVLGGLGGIIYYSNKQYKGTVEAINGRYQAELVISALTDEELQAVSTRLTGWLADPNVSATSKANISTCLTAVQNVLAGKN